MHPFLSALVGGVLIGLAATFLLLLKGRVMGVSGILSGVLPPMTALSRGDALWRLSFLAGTIAATAAIFAVHSAPTMPVFKGSVVDLVLAGALVGAGTVIGNGCTSGHGVCGLSRLSVRSLVATLVFMSVAMLTVFALRAVRGA